MDDDKWLEISAFLRRLPVGAGDGGTFVVNEQWYQSELERLQRELAERNKVIELVYGLLWTTVDMPDGITQPPATYPPHATLSKARERLLTLLDREGQKRGIIAARLVLGGDTHE